VKKLLAIFILLIIGLSVYFVWFASTPTPSSEYDPMPPAPSFVGVREVYSIVGEPIALRDGVVAFDVYARELEFHINTGDLNIHALGTYTVYFYATDEWGATTTVSTLVHIVELYPAAVYALADEILLQILREGMTQMQQARAIFDWVSTHINFVSALGADSVYAAAHHGLIHRRGNCYVFSSLMKIMLTRAGIPNERIARIPDTGESHTWNIFNPDGFGWFHLDATPNFFVSHDERFMFTNTHAAEFSQRFVYEREDGIREFYTFDPEHITQIIH